MRNHSHLVPDISRELAAGSGLWQSFRHALSFGVALSLLLAAGAVFAQFRQIPDSAKRGTIRHVQSMLINIDGKEIFLSPGGTIRDRDNRIIVPSALPPSGTLAEYVTDTSGQVTRVWLLTEEETRRPKKPAAP